MKYIHQSKQWPNFTYDEVEINKRLLDIKKKQGYMLGKLAMVGLEDKEKINLEILSLDVIRTSAIEGEILDHDSVRSSIARKLGIDDGGILPKDRNADGIIEITLDATKNSDASLTKERLFSWHAALFPTGWSGIYSIDVAKWRAGKMQVVSGAFGKEKIHFEAIEAEKLDHEMELFLDWFNSDQQIDLIIKSAIAHLWFVTIHPFDDGNGRIARAITDLMLTRADDSQYRFYSLSTYVDKDRSNYYKVLEQTQKGNLDITDWLDWFLSCLDSAIDGTEALLDRVIYKTKFWNFANKNKINERQRKIINRLLDGFQGNMTTSKYAKIAKCSNDTALRDIKQLVDFGVMLQGKTTGRGTSYSIVDLEDL